MYKITRNKKVVATIKQELCTLDVIKQLIAGGWGIEL
jgi:hypothetical protein